MFQAQVPVGLSLILALGAGSAAWTAKLDSKDGSKISGTARVETVLPAMTPPKDSVTPPKDSTPVAPAEASPEELRVSITVAGAPANASLGWGLYTGKCGDSNAGAASAALGMPASYTPIKIDAQGNGTATSMVKGGPSPASGDYYVGVQRPEGGKLAACGNLEPAKTSTGG